MKPQPPPDITDEALEEWHRSVKAIEALGREVKPADRNILAVYCRTYSIHKQCADHVKQFGAVIKYANGCPGQSPQYKTYKETTTLLRNLMADLGLTPQSRDYDQQEEAPEPEEDLDI